MALPLRRMHHRGSRTRPRRPSQRPRHSGDRRRPTLEPVAQHVPDRDVVTLTGFVDTCAAKLAAERAARRVHGVKAVANDIQLRVRLPRTDAEIAADCVRALELRVHCPMAQVAIAA